MDVIEMRTPPRKLAELLYRFWQKATHNLINDIK